MKQLSIALFIAIALPCIMRAQGVDDARLKELRDRYDALQAQQDSLLGPIEDAKLAIMQRDLAATGLPALAPGDVVTVHPGHSLVWDETHHVPKWTAHIVMPDIISRSW